MPLHKVNNEVPPHEGWGVTSAFPQRLRLKPQSFVLAYANRVEKGSEGWEGSIHLSSSISQVYPIKAVGPSAAVSNLSRDAVRRPYCSPVYALPMHACPTTSPCPCPLADSCLQPDLGENKTALIFHSYVFVYGLVCPPRNRLTLHSIGVTGSDRR
jgi:hypothetical protein